MVDYKVMKPAKINWLDKAQSRQTKSDNVLFLGGGELLGGALKIVANRRGAYSKEGANSRIYAIYRLVCD